MFEKLRTLLSQQFKIDESKITPDSDLKNDLHADSIDFIQVLMTVEEQYGITIPDEALATFVKVGDIVEYLEKNT